MPRDSRGYLEDILESTRKITAYTGGLSKAGFLARKRLTQSCELPEDLRVKHSPLDWKKIAGLRDILIHEYFGLDAEIVWDIAQNKVPTLDREVRTMLNDLG